MIGFNYPSALADDTDTIYETCLKNSSDYEISECVSNKLELIQKQNVHDSNTWYLIFASSSIFFMQAGFAMLCAGNVRIKNVGNTMLKNLLDACGAAIGFFTVGFAFAFGGQSDEKNIQTTFIGTSNFLMQGLSGSGYAFWVFEFAFAATSATIVAGTLAERCQMAAYLCYSVLLTGFVFPVVAHAIWSKNGFLSPSNADPFLGVGAIDVAGSTVVHVTGGCTALFATIILGPRRGRFYDARGNPLPRPKPFPGHSMALQMLGTFILWFGWYGFNTGSTLTISDSSNVGHIAALSAVNTTLSAAMGGINALFTSLFIEERLTGEAKFDLKKLMNGSLSGLVSITAGCAVVEPWAAIVIGFVGGWIYLLTSSWLLRRRIDDAVDAIPVHLFCGMWGTFAVGFLASESGIQGLFGSANHVGWFYSLAKGSFDAHLLAAQVVCILFVIGWVLVLMFPFFICLNYMGWFRADSLEELVGLDISYHGGQALAGDEVRLEYIEAFNRRRSRNADQRLPDSTIVRRSDINVQEMVNPYPGGDVSPEEEAGLEALNEDEDVEH